MNRKIREKHNINKGHDGNKYGHYHRPSKRKRKLCTSLILVVYSIFVVHMLKRIHFTETYSGIVRNLSEKLIIMEPSKSLKQKVNMHSITTHHTSIPDKIIVTPKIRSEFQFPFIKSFQRLPMVSANIEKINQKSIDKTTNEMIPRKSSIGIESGPTNKTTLALLYPPGLQGGYRNQVIRFFGLVIEATKQHITQLLLPTLLWTTTIDGGNNNMNNNQQQSNKNDIPIPMDMLFDIDHWNSFSDHLPVLIEDIEHGDCWSSHKTNIKENFHGATTMSQNSMSQIISSKSFLTPMINESYLFASGQLDVNIRKVDYFHKTENCTHPKVYGGGGTFSCRPVVVVVEKRLGILFCF